VRECVCSCRRAQI